MTVGIVRKIDDKGRILIPSLLLEQMGLKEATEFSISINEGKLTLSPVEGSGDKNEKSTRKNKS